MSGMTARGLHRLQAVLRGPTSGWAWHCTVHHMVGFPVAVALSAVTLGVVVIAGVLTLTAALAPVGAALLTQAVRGLTAVQRSRLSAVLGVHIAPVAVPGRDAGNPWATAIARLRHPATWRQVVYHLLAPVTGAVGFVATTAAWSVGAALAVTVTYAGLLPHEHAVLGWSMDSPRALAALTVAGLVLLLAAPWLARSLAALDVAAARALLGLTRADELAHQLETVSESREGLVDAADAERRRIERDLHDGTQQRLVSLAMNLGMARAALADAPEPARRAIEAAHEEAKQALAELRDFVRGLHPAILDDRGLDAALSGIAARAPLPVNVTVSLTRRCAPAIEAVAYFVVSEALTNIARHAQASRALVRVDEVGHRLRVMVSDDGRGGADPARGSGLRGLRQRVAAVDGTLTIVSPDGGPTVIMAELPCGR